MTVAQGTPRSDELNNLPIDYESLCIAWAKLARELERENAALSAQVAAKGREAAFFADAPNLDAERERLAADLCQWCDKRYSVKEIFSEALKNYASLCLRENLIRSVEIASEKDERIERLSAQVKELQKKLEWLNDNCCGEYRDSGS